MIDLLEKVITESYGSTSCTDLATNSVEESCSISKLIGVYGRLG